MLPKLFLRRLSTMTTKLLNRDFAQEIKTGVDNFLFDCDGVLWDGSGPIDGSLETILKLKELGKKVFYVTNNSSSSRQAYVKKCEKYGFPAKEEEIVCTAYVAAEYLKQINFRGKVYLMGKEESLGKELSDVGITYIGPGPDPVQGVTYEDFFATELDAEVNCVMVGFDPYISYRKMIKATSYLKNPNCMFLVTNEDSILPAKGAICIPGTGCITTPIKLASQREPVVMGKPSTNMFDILSKVHKLDPSKTMMVGDRYDTDMVFAKNCGMAYSFLVLTGSTSKADIEGGKASARFYAPSLGELGKLL